MENARLLIVDDDRELSSMLATYLAGQGYQVTVLDHGGGLDAMLAQAAPDLLILDVMLPGEDGLSIARRLSGSLPILMLSAKGEDIDRILGLEFGADDYLAKPFHMEELLARVRALIRRGKGRASAELVCGPVTLDTRRARVAVAGQPVNLTAQEFKVLAYLMHKAGEVVSRTELTEHIYAQDFDRDSNTVEVFIGRLRKKLGHDLIETHRGMGYRLARWADADRSDGH